MGYRILVPVDGSKRAKEGLEYAFEHYPDAEITALHVVSTGGGDLSALAGTGGELPDSELDDEEAEAVLDAATRLADQHGFEIETERMRGRPDRAIVKRVEDGEFDLVVIGSHGRDGVARVLLGSVAERVVRRSPIPVLVVR
jgi:nucleotide-binding universal stress UspA family protein